ncbi:MAG TPA: cytochrome c maturation protein CcmE [Ferruginibacter sp.]|nr:cytochrome c maturation protein CcmE [Ferruginibacter sp.]
MKKTHIVILVGIAALIMGLIVFSASDFSTYDTISGAKKKPGKYLHIIAKIDKSQPIVYDAVKDPNYLSFVAMDSLGGSAKVIYHKGKPQDLEKSETLVIAGTMKNDQFECDNILLKCPSKYKDDKKQLENTVSEKSGSY